MLPRLPRECIANRAIKRYCTRSEEHTSELQSRLHLVCRLLPEKKERRDGSLAHKGIDAADYGCRSVGFGIGGVCGYGDGDFRAQEGNRIDESARGRRLPSLRIIFCRGHAVSADQRPSRISRWRIAGEANWPLHFRVSDYDRAGAASDYSRHRYRNHVCVKHVGNPTGAEIRPELCIASSSMNLDPER